MFSLAKERFQALDLHGPQGGVLGCSLFGFLFALAAILVPAPTRLHEALLGGAMGESLLALIAALQLFGIIPEKRQSDVQDLRITG